MWRTSAALDGAEGTVRVDDTYDPIARPEDDGPSGLQAYARQVEFQLGRLPAGMRVARCCLKSRVNETKQALAQVEATHKAAGMAVCA